MPAGQLSTLGGTRLVILSVVVKRGPHQVIDVSFNHAQNVTQKSPDSVITDQRNNKLACNIVPQTNSHMFKSPTT